MEVVCNSIVLRLAKQKGIITHLGTILKDLRSAGFYMGKEYYEILKDAGES